MKNSSHFSSLKEREQRENLKAIKQRILKAFIDCVCEDILMQTQKKKNSRKHWKAILNAFPEKKGKPDQLNLSYKWLKKEKKLEICPIMDRSIASSIVKSLVSSKFIKGGTCFRFIEEKTKLVIQ